MLKVAAEKGVTVKANLFHGLNEVPKMIDLSNSGKMAGKAVCIIDEKQL